MPSSHRASWVQVMPYARSAVPPRVLLKGEGPFLASTHYARRRSKSFESSSWVREFEVGRAQEAVVLQSQVDVKSAPLDDETLGARPAVPHRASAPRLQDDPSKRSFFLEKTLMGKRSRCYRLPLSTCPVFRFFIDQQLHNCSWTDVPIVRRRSHGGSEPVNDNGTLYGIN